MLSLTRLAELFAAHAGPLGLYARQFGDDADDLEQEAFVRLMDGQGEPPNVRAWLATTVRHAVIDRRRAIFRRRRREASRAAAAWFEPAPASLIDGVLDGRDVTMLLTALPPRQREVVVLRLWNDLTFAEIAAVVGVSDSTAHGDFRAAIATLKQNLEARCKTTRYSDNSASSCRPRPPRRRHWQSRTPPAGGRWQGRSPAGGRRRRQCPSR